jgi:kinesin family protein C1
VISAQLADSRALNLNQRKELVGFSDEIAQLKKTHAKEIEELEGEMQKREEETRAVSEELRLCRHDLERERESTTELRQEIGRGGIRIEELEAKVDALEARRSQMRERNEYLEASLATTKDQLSTSDAQLAYLKREVVEAEITRRKLHNMVMELKGNIRVFCRVRPVLRAECPLSSTDDVAADIKFPDANSDTPNSIELTSSTPTYSGDPREETHAFTFDRVFPPGATQAQVFEEIELLVQSCVDGHNVCVFAYGQTGSGKSWTMEGGSVCFAVSSMLKYGTDVLMFVDGSTGRNDPPCS